MERLVETLALEPPLDGELAAAKPGAFFRPMVVNGLVFFEVSLEALLVGEDGGDQYGPDSLVVDTQAAERAALCHVNSFVQSYSLLIGSVCIYTSEVPLKSERVFTLRIQYQIIPLLRRFGID